MTNLAYQFLREQADIMHRSGDPSEPFYYLAGPMTGLPQFNFPEFVRVAEKLRASGFNIISPAEIDDTETVDAVRSDTDGTDEEIVKRRFEYLERDVIICAMPTCKGGIFLEGWEESKGAQLESYVLQDTGKELLRFLEDTKGGFYLAPFDRNLSLLGAELAAHTEIA